MQSLTPILPFILQLDALKTIERQTKLLTADRRENDAEHSYHIAMMAVVLSDAAPDTDLLRVLEMLLVHDIVEIDAGDTFAYDAEGYMTKSEREENAARRIYGLLPEAKRDQLYHLWREFEEGSTPEALFANTLDRLQPILHNIYNGGGTWMTHHVSWEQLMRRMEPIRRFSPLWADEVSRAAAPYFEDAPAHWRYRCASEQEDNPSHNRT